MNEGGRETGWGFEAATEAGQWTANAGGWCTSDEVGSNTHSKIQTGRWGGGGNSADIFRAPKDTRMAIVLRWSKFRGPEYHSKWGGWITEE